MARDQIKVPFGYDSRKLRRGQSCFETFEDWTAQEMSAFIAWAEERKFVRVVFYPQHEETLRRMDIRAELPYYARVKQLKNFLRM